VICDAGLPIPPNIQRIDLALRQGVPGFLETVETVLLEMEVERAVIASEISQHSPQVEAALRKLLGSVPFDTVSHETFKQETHSARAIIRTGEFTRNPKKPRPDGFEPAQLCDGANWPHGFLPGPT
jgi:D-ribose pyranase